MNSRRRTNGNMVTISESQSFPDPLKPDYRLTPTLTRFISLSFRLLLPQEPAHLWRNYRLPQPPALRHPRANVNVHYQARPLHQQHQFHQETSFRWIAFRRGSVSMTKFRGSRLATRDQTEDDLSRTRNLFVVSIAVREGSRSSHLTLILTLSDSISPRSRSH